MYDFLRGAVAARAEGAVVLETHGVGYRLAVSASTLRRVPPAGEECRLYTHLVVREESHALYGFADEAERHLFRQLLLVTGVGPVVALALLSAHEPPLLASLIAGGDTAALVRVKGIGKRTAERILVELRDRFAKAGAGGGAGGGATGSAGTPAGDAVLALCSLGLPRPEAERRVGEVAAPGLDVAEIVRRALRR